MYGYCEVVVIVVQWKGSLAEKIMHFMHQALN